jgi:hypothetical protein
MAIFLETTFAVPGSLGTSSQTAAVRSKEQVAKTFRIKLIEINSLYEHLTFEVTAATIHVTSMD